ncbi:hypothetical protein A4T38_15005 [Escherichia coli]|nr:hypothetical protein A4T38_15005 [Escherichia coli]
MTDFGGKTSIFSHPVYLFLRKFSLQDSRGGSTSSYARKYCLNGLFGIDDAKDADTDEHKHQQNAAAKQSKPSLTPEQVLKAFTDAAMQKNTVEELKQAFAKAWKMLEGTPEQHKAQDVYNIRRDELEGATA